MAFGGEVMPTEKYLTIPELARLLGVSRVTVYNWVKKGLIPAAKAGRNYIITDKTMNEIFGGTMTPEKKRKIDAAVRRTVQEYGKILKRLSRE
jgi:excisionase family DNA binding protein